MPPLVAEWIVMLATVYLLLGLAFAAPFLARGVQKMDSHAEAAGLAVRLILLPGTMVLWPVLLKRWLRGDPVPVEHTAHRNGAAEVRSI